VTHAEKNDCDESKVAQKEIWDAWRFGRSGGRRACGNADSAEGGEILSGGLDNEDDEDHDVGIVDVEHESGDEAEAQPLPERTSETRFVPKPEKEGDDEGGMRVGPRGIEVHVDGKRAGQPDGDGGEQGPAFLDVLARNAEGKVQTEKTVEGGGERHGDAIGSGEAVGGDGGTECASELDAHMGDEEKRRPENSRADSEMVVEMAGGGAEFLPRLSIFVEARGTKTLVSVAIIFGEVEIVLDERSAGKSVVANAVAADPWIEKRERQQEKKQKQAPGIARARSERRAGALLVHEGGTRRTPFLFPATIITGQHHSMERYPQD
jgi:hypothetical protein